MSIARVKAWMKLAESALAAESTSVRATRASDTAQTRLSMPKAPAISMPSPRMPGVTDATAGARSLPSPPV